LVRNAFAFSPCHRRDCRAKYQASSVGARPQPEALAVDAGIDRTYVSRLERGLENPTVVVLEKLARALSSNIEEFFRAPRPGEAAPKPLKGGRRPRK
jgi:transcriptional regulator with XRE-family HTH domain